MDLLPDLAGHMTTNWDVERAAVALAERLEANPSDEDCREAIWRLRVRCGRYGYRRPKQLPEVRPSAEVVAERLGCLQALKEAGLCVLYREDKEALDAAWDEMATNRYRLDLHGRRGGGQDEMPWPFRYRVLEQEVEGTWKPMHLIFESRELSGVKSTGFLQCFPVDAWALEDLEIEDFPVRDDHRYRISPILEGPADTDPSAFLTDLVERGATATPD